MFYTWDFGFAGVRSSYYWYKRKIYLYDEINQRVLASEYFGDMNEIEHYKMGFDYCGDSREFWMNRRMYKLPRPIDEKAIKQIQEQEDAIRREYTISDSVCWEQIKEEFGKLPVITQEKLNDIQLFVKKWTNYYKIDFSQAKFIKHSDADFNSKPERSACNWEEFSDKDDSPSLLGVTYSPDKQRYIDINISYETVKGVHYYTSHAMWSIDLVDRKEKHQNHLFCEAPYHPISTLHDVFWVNKDVFIIAGTNNSYCSLDVPCTKDLKHVGRASLMVYAIYVFDINAKTITEYGLLDANITDWSIDYSYFEEYLKERGIVLRK